MHRVNIKYRPDSENPEGQEEILRFSSEVAARDFAKRQEKLPQVEYAKYMGGNPHA